jgi:2-polyprenyl-6-methoxyphenol hydroxylase-like FAD-dependent oxidoreductase
MHANIIGAGIAGPMAAITLRENGFAVDVWEKREAHELYSHGILGITDESWDILLTHGTDAAKRNLPISGHGDLDGLVWTDLHITLSERATRMGANFHYGQTFNGVHTDITVSSTGVGSAKEVTTPHYTGYTIIRGLASQLSGHAWSDMNYKTAEGTPWYFMAGDIPDGTSVAMFVPRSAPTLRTTYSTDMPEELRALPREWRALVKTVSEWQLVPMSDWDVPTRMVRKNGSTPIVRIGDANGQLRPMTAMGANLALSEASDVDLLIRQSLQAESRHLAARRVHHDEGIWSGI